MAEWLNVKDAKPKEDEIVVVMSVDGFVNIAYYDSSIENFNLCFDDPCDDGFIVDLWFPLPDPKEGLTK